MALAISIVFFLLVTISTKLGWCGFNSTSVNIKYIVSNPLLLNFAAGSLIGAYARKIKSLEFKLNQLIIIISLMLTEVFIDLIGGGNFIISVFISISMPSLIIYFCTALESKSYKKLLLIGNASYSIYLSHVTVLMFKGKLQALLPYKGFYFVTALNIIFVFLCVMIGSILYTEIEKKLNTFFTKKPMFSISGSK